MDTRTGIKLGKAFLFRFHRRVNSKGVKLPTPLSHSLERLSKFYSVCIKCLTNGKCVTVVATTGLHFRAFHLLTLAASHDLKETIDKDYCECGMPLETVRESEAPLKERSERV